VIPEEGSNSRYPRLTRNRESVFTAISLSWIEEAA